MPSLTQNVKPNRKPIRTKHLNHYHLRQKPNAYLSLRPYATILAQIKPNLQGCIIKAVLVLTAISYPILKILKSNVLKIIGIKILYPLYTYNPSYALVDHLLITNRSCPIFHWAKTLYWIQIHHVMKGRTSDHDTLRPLWGFLGRTSFSLYYLPILWLLKPAKAS